MSYQVLARKWRPRSFEDMVGQGHVMKTLTNALDTDRLHHAYLFTGTRGVGKTTLARILAKCLNCEKGVSSSPCGVCSACQSIDEGRFVDLIEVDAASRAKVEETRDLMDNVQYAPTVGRYKVYLIDEVHMFSNHSFNALLKTLEEPPPHVKFLLATTEPKKLPITILSRCLQFNLMHLTLEQIGGQLNKILVEEDIVSDSASIKLLSQAANGSMRDGLSLLDQAIAYNNGKLEEAQLREMLGTIDRADINGLIDSLAEGDAGRLLEQVDRIATYNANYDAILSELLSKLHNIAVAQALADDAGSLDESSQVFANKLSREDVQLFYQIGLNGRRDLAISPDPRSGFEMTMIRMLSFRPLEKTPIRLEPPTGTRPEAVSNTNTVSDTSVASKTDTFGKKPQPEESSRSGESQGFEKPQSKVKVITDNSNWQRMIDEMGLDGLVRELASQCILKEATDKCICLSIDASHERFLSTSSKQHLQSSLRKHYGEKIKLDIKIEELSVETPSEQRAREEKQRHDTAVEGYMEDPNVKSVIEAFSGSLNKDSIQTQ